MYPRPSTKDRAALLPFGNPNAKLTGASPGVSRINTDIRLCLFKRRLRTGMRLLCFAPCFLICTTANADISVQRQQALDNLLKHDCGACHGLHRSGGLGPALTAHNLQKHSLESLTVIILNGRPGTAMPGWAGLLNAEEAGFLARQLKTGARPAP